MAISLGCYVVRLVAILCLPDTIQDLKRSIGLLVLAELSPVCDLNLLILLFCRVCLVPMPARTPQALQPS